MSGEPGSPDLINLFLPLYSAPTAITLFRKLHILLCFSQSRIWRWISRSGTSGIEVMRRPERADSCDMVGTTTKDYVRTSIDHPCYRLSYDGDARNSNPPCQDTWGLESRSFH